MALLAGAMVAIGAQATGAAPADLPLGQVIGTLAPGSTLVGCGQANQVIQVTADAHLDPSCTYTKGLEITASDVTLDCQGAVIESAPDAGGRGILLTTPVDVPLANVTVRNCIVGGFLNTMRVTRAGFKTLTPDNAYDNTTSNILIENVALHDSRGVGLFVDGYTSDVTMRDLTVTRAGSSGIYLEAGSRQNLVERVVFTGNGIRENGPDGQTLQLGGETYRWWGTGREGLSIDGSRDNVVRNNTFVDNMAGGIFLYKNCGEFVNDEPAQHWSRWTPASGNLIEANTFTHEDNGVWVASRAAENQLFMDCSDTPYVSDAITRIYRDPATDNTVRNNAFTDVTYGVRVEDDRTVVEGNVFTSDVGAHMAVLVGTLYRTEVLGEPVAGAVVRNNTASIAGNTHPYRWIHGLGADTTYADNVSLDAAVVWCAGEQPPIDPFLFVVQFQLDGPDAAPTTTIPATAAPAPCPSDPTVDPVAAPTAGAVVTPAFTG